MSKTVMLTNPAFDPAAERLLREKGYEVVVAPDFDIDEDTLIKMINENGVCALYARVERITRRVIESCKTLKVIVENGAGVDNIDVQAATDNGVQVINLPNGPVIPVSESAIAYIFALAKEVVRWNNFTKAGQWTGNLSGFRMVEILGKTLFIVGFGNIGKAVAKKANALEMVVQAYDPYVTAEEMSALNVKKIDVLEDGLRTADFTTVHLPLNKETENMFAAPQFKVMKNEGHLINLGRGPIVNVDDLCEALKSGEIAGYATDVFDKEPTTESPLFQLENTVVAPHTAGSTRTSMADLAEMGVNSMAAALGDSDYQYNCVNRKGLAALAGR